MLSKEQKAVKSEYINDVIRESFGESMRKYFEKSIDRVVRLHDGRMVAIEKPSIHKDFCFGESGYDYEDAAHMAHHARTSESYFISENMKPLDRAVEQINQMRKDPRWSPKSGLHYMSAPGNSKVCYLKWIDNLEIDNWHRPEETDRDVTEEDLDNILAAYAESKKDFRKRLDTYLKRYGLSKVRSWTYWRDA